MTMQAMSRLSKNTRQDMEAARKLLTQARADLDRVQATAHLASPEAPGFLPKINSQRMGAAPPRPVSLLSQAQTWSHWEKLLEELLSVCDVVKVACLANTKH